MALQSNAPLEMRLGGPGSEGKGIKGAHSKRRGEKGVKEVLGRIRSNLGALQRRTPGEADEGLVTQNQGADTNRHSPTSSVFFTQQPEGISEKHKPSRNLWC